MIAICSINIALKGPFLGSFCSLHASAPMSLRDLEQFPNQEREKNDLLKTPIFGVYPFLPKTKYIIISITGIAIHIGKEAFPGILWMENPNSKTVCKNVQFPLR